MKKLISLLFLLVLATTAVLAQTPDTVVIAEPGGFRGFYEKYSGAIWMILGLTGVSAFLWYRIERVRDALTVLIDAGQDNHVTEAEWQAIAAAFKKIWGKKQ